MYNEPGPMNASFQYELALPKLYTLLLVGTMLPVMFALLADILPLTAKLVNVPTDVMLDCAAVVNEPATVVNTPAAAPMLPTLALAVTLKLANVPVLVIFGCAAVDNVPVSNVPITFPPVMLPVAVTTPPVVKLPPDTLPVAVINPPVPKLPTLALPTMLNVCPDMSLFPVAPANTV